MSAVESLPTRSSVSPPSRAACEAARGLYERHADRILGFCLRRLRSRDEAEDAVQNTFVNALRALQRGVVPISEEAWLFKIAENVCLETHRTNGRRRSREIPEGEELVDPVAADREPPRYGARELVAALARIPEGQRKALLLREWRGLSYREIADELGCTVGAVETLIFRARRNLAQQLSDKTTKRSRVASVLDVGSLLGALKTLFGGATAVKLAAATAVLAVATLPAGDSPVRPAQQRSPAIGMVEPAAPDAARPTVPTQDQASTAAPERRDTEPRRRDEQAASAEAPNPRAPGTSVETPGRSTAGPSSSTAPPQTLPVAPPVTTNVPPPPVQLPEAPVELPELPVQVPELPAPPELPLDPNELINDLPELPQLPELP